MVLLRISTLLIISFLTQVEAQCSYWTTSQNQGSPSGIYQGGRSITECQYLCLAYNNCRYGFDFVESSKQCWISISSTLNFAANVQHWVCSSSAVSPACQPSYSQSVNKHYTGGSMNSETTLDGCKSSCSNQVSCIGIDFNHWTNPQQCWILTQTSLLLDSNGVDHYDKNIHDCFKTTPKFVTPNVCQPTFSLTSNKHFAGGSSNGETTLAGCQTSCINQLSCIGFDFNYAATPNQCWILTKTTALADQQGVNHYDINRSPTNCNPSAFPLYTLTKDMKVVGGIKSGSSTSLEVCKIECVNLPTCVGFDFNKIPTPQECWLLYNTGNLISSPGVDHYDLTRNYIRSLLAGNCLRREDTSAIRTDAAPENVTSADDCDMFCSNTVKCTFGAVWNSLAAPGQQCLYAMKFYLYEQTGFTYFECSKAGVLEAANVTSEFLGDATEALTEYECSKGCLSQQSGFVWSHREGKCYPVLPNKFISKDGYTFMSCKV